MRCEFEVSHDRSTLGSRRAAAPVGQRASPSTAAAGEHRPCAFSISSSSTTPKGWLRHRRRFSRLVRRAAEQPLRRPRSVYSTQSRPAHAIGRGEQVRRDRARELGLADARRPKNSGGGHQRLSRTGASWALATQIASANPAHRGVLEDHPPAQRRDQVPATERSDPVGEQRDRIPRSRPENAAYSEGLAEHRPGACARRGAGVVRDPAPRAAHRLAGGNARYGSSGRQLDPRSPPPPGDLRRRAVAPSCADTRGHAGTRRSRVGRRPRDFRPRDDQRHVAPLARVERGPTSARDPRGPGRRRRAAESPPPARRRLRRPVGGQPAEIVEDRIASSVSGGRQHLRRYGPAHSPSRSRPRPARPPTSPTSVEEAGEQGERSNTSPISTNTNNAQHLRPPQCGRPPTRDQRRLTAASWPTSSTTRPRRPAERPRGARPAARRARSARGGSGGETGARRRASRKPAARARRRRAPCAR